MHIFVVFTLSSNEFQNNYALNSRKDRQVLYNEKQKMLILVVRSLHKNQKLFDKQLFFENLQKLYFQSLVDKAFE